MSASPGAVAYACARLGWRVFPLRRDTGTPVFTGWPEQATSDLDQIKEWWTGNYELNGVGIATGPESGIWVLDIDVKDADGFSSLRELTQAHGDTSAAFTDTLCVRTPSGGAHVYFRWNEAAASEGGIRNSAKTLGRGLDVRGIRGYVRAPEVNGYAVIERDGVKIMRVKDAPAWLVPLCKKRRTISADERTNADVRARLSAGGDRWARFEAAESLRKLARSAAGTRNDMLNRTAFRLGTLSVHSAAIDRKTALAWCLAAMRDAGANDTPEQQERTFTSGWNSGRERETAKAVDPVSASQ